MKKIKTYKTFESNNTEIDIDVDEMLKSYINAYLWIAELDDTYDFDDFIDEDLVEPRKDIIYFINRLKEIIKKIHKEQIIPIIPIINKFSPYGYHLYLTRNRYGTGFWDVDELDIEFTPSRNPYDKPYILRDILTAISEEMGPADIYFKKLETDKAKKKFNL